MGLLQHLSRRLNPELVLAELADQLAEHCFDPVWERVQEQLLGLSPAEARGYIRARGTAIVRPTVVRASTLNRVALERQPLLYSLTTEALIRRILAHGKSQSRHDAMRRAA